MNRTKRATEATLCPWPHNIDKLVGVKPMPIEELPKTCTCGTTLAYAETVMFISEPKVEGLDPSVVQVTPIQALQVREAVLLCCYGTVGCTKGNLIAPEHDCGKLKPKECRFVL